MANKVSRHGMTKWHPRKSDGKAVRCEADVRKCPRTKEGEVHVYANTPGEAQRKIDAIKAEYAGEKPSTPVMGSSPQHPPAAPALLLPHCRKRAVTPEQGRRGSRCPSLNRGASANAS